MKRKWIILTAIVLVVICIAGVNIYRSEKHTIAYIQNQLHNRYDLNFEFVKSLEAEEENRSFYLFSTTDENRLSFKVKYWIGAMATPWGEQPLIQTRHVVDEFPKAVREYVVSQSPYATYDITNIPIEEAAKSIISLIEDTKKALNNYGIGWESHDVDITIIYNGKAYDMTFGTKSESIIGDSIRTSIFQ